MTSTSSARSRNPKARPVTPKRRRSNIGQRIFRIILLILVVSAISVLATLYFVWPNFSPINLGIGAKDAKANATEKASVKPAPTINQKPIFVDFDPFTVTLTKDGRSRILYVGITLQVLDQDSQDLLLEYQPVVRDRILRVLATQDANQVQTNEGRQALIHQLEQTLAKPYPPAAEGPNIHHVLFTTFVVQ